MIESYMTPLFPYLVYAQYLLIFIHPHLYPVVSIMLFIQFSINCHETVQNHIFFLIIIKREEGTETGKDSVLRQYFSIKESMKRKEKSRKI